VGRRQDTGGSTAGSRRAGRAFFSLLRFKSVAGADEKGMRRVGLLARRLLARRLLARRLLARRLLARRLLARRREC
jgi:hypothetical protein